MRALHRWNYQPLRLAGEPEAAEDAGAQENPHDVRRVRIIRMELPQRLPRLGQHELLLLRRHRTQEEADHAPQLGAAERLAARHIEHFRLVARGQPGDLPRRIAGCDLVSARLEGASLRVGFRPAAPPRADCAGAA